MKTKKQNVCVSTGDLVHYCPADMREKNHDIGIIYEIEEVKECPDKKIKIYKIFWSRSQDYDAYSDFNFYKRLKMKIRNQNIFKLIKQNE